MPSPELKPCKCGGEPFSQSSAFRPAGRSRRGVSFAETGSASTTFTACGNPRAKNPRGSGTAAQGVQKEMEEKK